MNVLLIYASIEGQTGRIARFIESELNGAGHDVTLVDADQTESLPSGPFDKIILAAPVHERRHPRLFEALVTAQKELLDTHDTLMISVSLSAAFPEGLPEAEEYLREMEMRTDFKPDTEMLVAGALRQSRYDYFAAQVVRHVVMRGRDYDASQDVQEFTDWSALAQGVAMFVRGDTRA